MGPGFAVHRDPSRVSVQEPSRFLASADQPVLDFNHLDSSEEDPICERVSQNLQRLRAKRHLSLDALARQCGVSRAMLAQIESGRSVPSIKVLCKIANGLKVSVAAFLEHRAFEGVAVLSASQSKRLVSGYLYMGSPVKQARPLTDKERNFFSYTAGNYVKLKDLHLAEGYDQ